jgi:hypothetical protein
MIEPTTFYVVRGYDKDGKQVGETAKLLTPLAASTQALDLFYRDCKSVDIDLIESSDEPCGT